MPKKNKQKFILFNVDIANFKRGDKIPLDKNTPRGPRLWLMNKDILIEDRICFLVDQNGKKLDDDLVSQKHKGRERKKDKTKGAIKCKGFNDDGSYCQRTDLEPNGFCIGHQAQAEL